MSWSSAAYSSSARSASPRPWRRAWCRRRAAGPGRDVARVRLVVLAALGQGHHAAPPHVGIGLGPGQGARVAVDVVEQDALAQRPLAEDQLLDAEPRAGRVEDHRPHGQDVGPRLVHAGQAQALAQVGGQQALAQLGSVARLHRDVVQRLRRLARLDLVGQRPGPGWCPRCRWRRTDGRASTASSWGASACFHEGLEPRLVLAGRGGRCRDEPLGHAQHARASPRPPSRAWFPLPSASSTLPPPMSTTSARRPSRWMLCSAAR